MLHCRVWILISEIQLVLNFTRALSHEYSLLASEVVSSIVLYPGHCVDIAAQFTYCCYNARPRFYLCSIYKLDLTMMQGLLSSYPFFTRTCTHVKVLTLLSSLYLTNKITKAC